MVAFAFIVYECYRVTMVLQVGRRKSLSVTGRTDFGVLFLRSLLPKDKINGFESLLGLLLVGLAALQFLHDPRIEKLHREGRDVVS